MNSKFLIYISTVIFAVLTVFYYGCQSIPDPVDYVIKRGGVDLRTYPDSSQIWVDGKNTLKITRDSVYDLEPGDYFITLKHFGYTDTAFSIRITKGICQQLTVVLGPHQVLDSAGPATLYGLVGATELKPSGLVLATGSAFNVLKKDSVDLFYFRDDATLKSPTYVTDHTKKTFFLLSKNTYLKDGVPVPKRYTPGDPDWLDSISDTTSGYFYVYDNNGHYSKIKITKRSYPNTDSASVDINGYYNLFPDSLSFQ